METRIELTRSELIALFEKWDSEYLKNPKSYTDIEATHDYAINHADYFLKMLEEIRK